MPWTKEQEAEETNRQKFGSRLCQNEILCCVSGLVSHILADTKEGSNLAELVMELTSPVLDYEEAATQAGWNMRVSFSGSPIFSKNGKEIQEHTDWPTLCEAENISPYEWEIFEYWAISDWLGDKLLEAGERVCKDFYGLCIWGRTCTGQSISMDHVIQRIAESVYSPNKGAVE